MLLGDWSVLRAGRLHKARRGGLLAALALWGVLSAVSCGDGKESAPSTQMLVNHSVPTWMLGKWKPLRLFNGEPVDGEDMLMTVTADHFEYYYPGCYVSGRLIMDKETPSFASNNYRLLMDIVNCPQNWDVATFQGQEDFGKIWLWVYPAETYMFRSSDKFADPFWTYIKILNK